MFVADNISEDRMIALRKRAEVDSKYIVNLVLDDGVQLKQSLIRYEMFLRSRISSCLFDYSFYVCLVFLMLQIFTG